MKRLTTSSLVGLAALVVAASNLSAQVCNGIAPFSAGNMRAGFGVRMPDAATVFDGEVAVGSASGLYGGANLAMSGSKGSVS